MAIFKMNSDRTHLILFEFNNEPAIKVGIGTETPIDKLHVAGNIRCEGISGNIELSTSSNVICQGDVFGTTHAAKANFVGNIKALGGIQYTNGSIQTTAGIPWQPNIELEDVISDDNKLISVREGRVTKIQAL